MAIEMKYPGARLRPSSIDHPARPSTWGVVMHWTAGREEGDLATLDGPNVDCQFYVTKAGAVYQLLDARSQAWHALRTANTFCIGIEHECLNGEDYTQEQHEASVALSAWIHRTFGVPLRHVDPVPSDVESFRGWFGHRDLSLGGPRVDGNNHTDTIPPGFPGWDRYIADVLAALEDDEEVEEPLEHGETLRLSLRFPDGRHLKFAGWDMCDDPMKWIAKNGLQPETAVAFSWKGEVWRYDPGEDAVKVQTDIENRISSLVRRFLD